MSCPNIDGIALLDALSAEPQQADDPATADGLCSAVYEGNIYLIVNKFLERKI